MYHASNKRQNAIKKAIKKNNADIVAHTKNVSAKQADFDKHEVARAMAAAVHKAAKTVTAAKATAHQNISKDNGKLSARAKTSHNKAKGAVSHGK